MRRFTLASAALALSLSAAPALADVPVEVTIGPDLAKKEASIGKRDIELVRNWLDKIATNAMNRPGAAPIARADLVLEDAVPNTPTFSQYGRNTQISMWSVGLGGARIGGTVTTTDGQVHPIRYAFYENFIWNQMGFTPWRDATRAFDMAARRIAKGDFVFQEKPMAPTADGDFGAWRANRARSQ